MIHRATSNNCVELIKYFEGFKPIMYLCSAGYPTIGYGHKILKNENYNGILSMHVAEKLLKQDLAKSEKAVLKYICNPLSNNQFDALVSFTFNLGAGALQRSTLRQKINYGSYNDAAEEFMRWVYARGRKLRGLAKRRQVEKLLFLS